MCMVVCFMLMGFFFFKQKTAYEMRISDWSSDVCSSDLTDRAREAVEITFETERLRAHIGLLIARRGFEPERAHRIFLQREQRELVGQVARDEGFSADRVEIAEIGRAHV